MDGDKRLRAEHYRTRAHEIRSVAEGVSHLETNRALLRLAASYERLALRLEDEPVKH